jgi:hypothetical protein
MSDEKPKIRIPQLTKKGRKLSDLNPNSLAAALHYRELAEPTTPPPTDQPASQPDEKKPNSQ